MFQVEPQKRFSRYHKIILNKKENLLGYKINLYVKLCHNIEATLPKKENMKWFIMYLY